VNAHLEVMVMVEFEATQPLLLSMKTDGVRMFEMEEEMMRMVAASGFIPAQVSNGTDNTNGTDTTDGTISAATPTASTPTSTIVLALVGAVVSTVGAA